MGRVRSLRFCTVAVAEVNLVPVQTSSAELTNQRTNTQLEVEIIKFRLRERALTQLEVEIFDPPILMS